MVTLTTMVIETTSIITTTSLDHQSHHHQPIPICKTLAGGHLLLRDERMHQLPAWQTNNHPQDHRHHDDVIVITKIIIIIKVPTYFETELKCMQTKRENS